MGVLFFACQKDERVVEEIAVDDTEMLSVERSCGDDASFCDFCATAGQCCCFIEWMYFTETDTFTHPSNYQFLPFPSFCAAMDIDSMAADCFIPIPCDSVVWNSVSDIFCPPFWPWPPFTPRFTYKCVPQGTGMSITNPNHPDTEIKLLVLLRCYSGSVTPFLNSYDVLPGETIEINFRDCRHQEACK